MAIIVIGVRNVYQNYVTITNANPRTKLEITVILIKSANPEFAKTILANCGLT